MALYCLHYSSEFGDRESIKSLLAGIEDINYWRFDLPNSVFVVTEMNVVDIVRKIRDVYPDSKFLVSEVFKDMADGWMPQRFWDLLKEYGNEEEKGTFTPLFNLLSSSSQKDSDSGKEKEYGH